MTASSIYLDHAATTPLHPQVLEAMLPYYGPLYGNPSSTHSFGREARAAVDRARDTIASALNGAPGTIVFTSGGTESDNLALFGAVAGNARPGIRPHIVTSTVEHHAVLRTCERLEKTGCDVTYVPVDRFGQVNPADVERAIRPETVLISIMYANNEVGTLQPVEHIGAMARERGVLFHTDAVQAIGVLPIDLSRLPVDLLSFSSHKLNGPKGVGALYVGRRVQLTAQLFGGSQERNKRAGTENVAGIAGFAKAVQLAASDPKGRSAELRGLRDLMIGLLDRELGDRHYAVNGHPTEVVPHILNVSLFGADTETTLMKLDLSGVAASGGSACTAGSLEESHVLRAMDLPPERTGSAVRFSFGFNTTDREISATVQLLATFLKHSRI